MTEETNGGSNLTELKKDIVKAVADVEKFKADKKSTGEDIQAIRENMASKGIPKKAFDMALKYKDMDPSDREGFDTAYAIMREAIGLPFIEQGDLFAKQKAEDAETEKHVGDVK